MLLQVYSVYDSGVQSWLSPMFFRSKGEMLRAWSAAVNNPESKFAQHPQDYCLFDLGTWDDDKCKFDLHKSPISLGVAIEFVKKVAMPSVKDAPTAS